MALSVSPGTHKQKQSIIQANALWQFKTLISSQICPYIMNKIFMDQHHPRPNNIMVECIWAHCVSSERAWLLNWDLSGHALLNCHIQCSVVITRPIHKYSQNTPHSSPVRTRYGVYFVNPASDWYSASVLVIIYVISYNIGSRYNGTRLNLVYGYDGKFKSRACAPQNINVLPL